MILGARVEKDGKSREGAEIMEKATLQERAASLETQLQGTCTGQHTRPGGRAIWTDGRCLTRMQKCRVLLY